MSDFYRYKLVLLGAAAVGKTSILHRFIKGKFAENYAMTIGVDFLSKEVEYENSLVKLTIWDLAGQEKFKFLRKNFYRGTHGALLIFDLTREDTFEEIHTWYAEMKELIKDDVPFILIGNKLDLVKEDNIITKFDTLKFSEDHNSIYMETSTKTGINIKEAFRKLISLITKQKNLIID